MDIQTRTSSGALVLEVSGRLDASWAPRLGTEIDECVRRGTHHLGLDLSGVTYRSSAGIRVLLVAARQLGAIGGSLAIVAASPQIRSVLQLSGLEELLGEASKGGETALEPAAVEQRRLGNLAVEVYREDGVQPLHCVLIGEPDVLAAGPELVSGAGSGLELGPDAFALGIGALGDDDDGVQRCGELLAAGGVAAWAPTDGADVPDFAVATGAFLPRARLLGGAVCRGGLPVLMRFEAEEGHPASLAELVGHARDLVAGTVGFVMAAESDGLLGATLKRSPVGREPAEPVFAHPGVRRWLSYTPERQHRRAIALVAGIACRGVDPVLGPFVRPLGSGGLFAHVHAAALPFRPLARGRIALVDTVGTLFEAPPLAVLHLLRDDRELMGGGDSAFMRGAIWAGPLHRITRERS